MKFKIIFFLALYVSVTAVFSQKAKVATANKMYDDYAYIDAISIYEQVAKKGYKSVDLFQKLGNAYYFNSEFEKAANAYESLFLLSQELEPEYFYRFSQSLKSIGNYTKADAMMVLFNQKSGTDIRANLYQENANYLEKIKANSGRFNIRNLPINSPQSDYGSAFFGDQLIFTSARDTGGLFHRKMKWTNQAFSNLYAAKVKVDGTIVAPEKFTKILNSKYNESSAVFSKDGKTMYFTRNNYTKGKKRKNKQNVTLLKLYKATFDEIEWVDVEELPFNSNEYNTAHPALSPDDKTLYFASDMPGSFGQSDLYKVKIYTDGSFSKPENLGNTINTEGKETFPFVSDNNEIYFASDGHPGLGGLDIFTSKINSDGSLEQINNVGEPVNSNADDFAFMIDDKSRNGFFSSNRSGGNGSDDIYNFTETRKITCEQLLAGNVVEDETGDFLANAQVILLDENFKIIQESYANDFGYYSFQVACNKTYYIRANKSRFDTKESKIIIPNEYGKTTANLPLEKRKKGFKTGDDVGPKLGIKIIYFDLNKSNIREDAAVELQKVLVLLQQYPTLKIDIRSHTDSRQTKKYNMKLSEKRAKSTIAWLINKGIAPNRLSGRGYGESALVNKCVDGVTCSEEEHQANRRSQFIVTKI